MLSTFDYSWTTKAATQPVGIKEEMIKKSTMAPIWQVGENVCSARSSRARRQGLRGHQGEESTQLSLSSNHPSSTEPSVCQDKQMRRHMLERLLENYWESFSSQARWKDLCNPMVFMHAAYSKHAFPWLLRMGGFSVQHLPYNVWLSYTLNMERFHYEKPPKHFNSIITWNQSSWLYWI